MLKLVNKEMHLYDYIQTKYLQRETKLIYYDITFTTVYNLQLLMHKLPIIALFFAYLWRNNNMLTQPIKMVMAPATICQ